MPTSTTKEDFAVWFWGLLSHENKSLNLSLNCGGSAHAYPPILVWWYV